MSKTSDILNDALNGLLDHVKAAPTRKGKLLLLDAAHLLISEMELELSPDEEKTLLVVRGYTKKIDAIKALRHCFAGLGLKEAKKYIEATESGPLVLCHKNHEQAAIVGDVLARGTAEVGLCSVAEITNHPGATDLSMEGYDPQRRS